MATDWSGRTRALANFEKALKNAKRFNDEDKEDLQEAVNALRRSQDHTAIQNKLNAAMKALRDLVSTLDDAGEPWPQLEAARAELGKSSSQSEGV